MSEIREFLERHLQAIFDNDIGAYQDSCASDLTLYEWYVTPHRIEGLPFHEFMMSEASREDTAGMALDPHPDAEDFEKKPSSRFEITNFREQRYGNVAVCSYTLLISRGFRSGVKVLSYNESRVITKLDGKWKVVHVHKSPDWRAPFQAPGAQHGAS
jgi:hypothetical protein